MPKNKTRRERPKQSDSTSSRPADEDPFQLRPRTPRGIARGDTGWSIALRTVLRYANASVRSRKAKSSGTGSQGNPRRSFIQRCAVRATYSQNKTVGQWRAHGIYLSRESATGENGRGAFGSDQAATNIGTTLGQWQEAGDQRLWKIILSPEFGERVDLEVMTREVMSRAEKQLGTRLEWVGVSHFNTEHPHVHLAIRGRREDGSPLQLPREFVKHGLRALAENACTLQLGPRTELDAQLAIEREVGQQRYTSLDRTLERRGASTFEISRESFSVRINAELLLRSSNAASLERSIQSRLVVLQKFGVAEQLGNAEWRVRSDFSIVLRAMQRASDRQRTLAAHGALISDERLKLQVLDTRNTPEVQGRVLGHGEEEQSNGSSRHYLLLEGTDARIHLVFYTPELDDARRQGKLKANNFVRLKKQQTSRRSGLKVDDLGSAELLLTNKAFLRNSARALLDEGQFPIEDGWAGWLGRYQKAICRASSHFERQQTSHER